MKVTILLADAAQSVGGKLYILGGGWSIRGPQPTPMALAIKVEVPWLDANTSHQLRLTLFDEDERPVMVPTPIGEQPFEIHSSFEVGRPPGLRHGTPIDFALALNLAPIPLQPNSRYVWRCFINDEAREEVRFSTLALPPPQPV